MLSFPIDIQDLSMFLAVNALILLVTLEVLSSQSGKTNLPINRQRLKIAAEIVSILFLASIAMNIVIVVLST